jgi:radical SAM protein with 4Fe4S-binding SPASM domain
MYNRLTKKEKTIIFFMDNILSLFPSVKKELIFRVTPDKQVGLIPNSGLYLNLSESAWQIYKLCNGSIDIGTLIIKLSGNWILNKDEVIDFLKDANNKGYIDLLNKGNYSQLNIVGDTQYNYPAHISLVVSTKCNLRCTYCYGDYSPQKNDFIPLEKVEYLFKTLSEKGLIGAELTGGEPLMHPDFAEILKLALKNILFVVVLSNGVLFTDEIFDILLKNRHKCCIQISIDGSNEITNSKGRQVNNTWDQTLNTIIKLVDMGINLKVAYILTPDNVSDLSKAAELMESIGVKNFSVSFAEGIGRGRNLKYEDNLAFSNSKSDHFKEVAVVIKEVTEKHKKIMPKRDSKFAGDLYFSEKTELNCGAGWKSVTIYPDGTITACPLLDKMLVLGNIFTDDITKIFNEGEINEFYKSFSKERVDEACSDCEYNNYCYNCITRIVLANKELISKGKKICHVAEKYKMAKVFNDFKYTIKYHI